LLIIWMVFVQSMHTECYEAGILALDPTLYSKCMVQV